MNIKKIKEIIILFLSFFIFFEIGACSLFSGEKITMPYGSSYYEENYTVEELISHLKKLGFENITTNIIEDDNFFHKMGEIENVGIDETFLGSWDAGDEFGCKSKITIDYYERTFTISEEGTDVKKILSCKDIWYSDFAEEYDGYFIEFNAIILSVIKDMLDNISAIIVCGQNDYVDGTIDGWQIYLDTERLAGDEKNIEKQLKEKDEIKVIARIDDYYTNYYKSIYAKTAYLIEI